MTHYVLPFKQGDKVLELGGGDHPVFRPNLDSRKLPTVDIVADLSKPLPISPESFDGIFGHYVLEHVSWRRTLELLKECCAALKPGGIACFFVPNTIEQFKRALTTPPDRWPTDVSQIVFGDNDYPENTHRAAFSPESALDLMRKAGFDHAEVKPHPDTPTDMVVYGYKSSGVPSKTGLKLNLGSFMDLLGQGWKNVDILPLNPHIPANVHFVSYDLRRGVQEANESVELINWSHMIEHVTLDEAKLLLRECWRVLVPGGVLRVSTPDALLICQRYLEGRMSDFDVEQTPEYKAAPTQGEKFSRLMYPGHLQCFDETTLSLYMLQSGFKDVKRVVPGESRSEVIKSEVKDTHPTLSLIMEGAK